MSTGPATPAIPTFSITICTRNRAALLSRTLDAVLQQLHLAAGPYPDVEILVIDNMSTDETAQTIKTYLASSLVTSIRYVCESTLGIAWARNRAIQEARGQWIIYLDDDAVPQPGWWENMQRCIQKLVPVPDCVLGKVDLEWEQRRPGWFPVHYESLLSCYDLGAEGHFVGLGGYLLTTNTAFRRRTLIEMGGFRTDLGHQGNNLLGGEDNDIFNRLIGQNCLIWYEPTAGVSHWVPRARQSHRWLIKRIFWEGATQPLLDYGKGLPPTRYLTEMCRDWRRALRISWRYRQKILDSNGRFDLLLEWVRQIGRWWMNGRLFLRGLRTFH